MAFETEIDKLLSDFKQTHGDKVKQTLALKWYRTRISNSPYTSKRNIRPEHVINDERKANKRTKNISSRLIGQLALYQYNPLAKDEIPYYDKYPLAIILDVGYSKRFNSKYFLTANLHYLPVKIRMALFTKLMKFNAKDDKTTLDYQEIMSLQHIPYFKNCIKIHIWKGIKSKPIIIPPDEWAIAFHIPPQFVSTGSAISAEALKRKVFRATKKTAFKAITR